MFRVKMPETDRALRTDRLFNFKTPDRPKIVWALENERKVLLLAVRWNHRIEKPQ
jgi:hypothetical protein